MLNRPLALAALILALPLAASASTDGDLAGLRDGSSLSGVMDGLDRTRNPIDGWALAPKGEWIVVESSRVHRSSGFDYAFARTLQSRIGKGYHLTGLDCRSDGTCIATWSAGQVDSSTGVVPADLRDTLATWYKTGIDVHDLALSKSGWVLLGDDGEIATGGSIPISLRKALADTPEADRRISDLAIGLDDAFALVATGNPMTSRAPTGMQDALWTDATEGRQAENLVLGEPGTYLIHDRDDVIAFVRSSDIWSRIEHGLGGSGKKSLWKRLDELDIPGASIALIDGHEVIGMRGYGRRLSKAETPIYTSTPFPIASLSKYAGALLTLVLQDTTSYGVSVSADALRSAIAAAPRGNIATWKADYDHWDSDRPDEADDLPSGGLPFRHLLSNTANTAPRSASKVRQSHVRYGRCDGTPADFLLGLDCSGSTIDVSDPDRYVHYDDFYDLNDDGVEDPWETGFRVGSKDRYSGGGFLLAEAALQDLTGEDIADLFEDELFGPLGLEHSHAAYPPPVSLFNQMAAQHDIDGTPQTDQMAVPWRFAGGLVMTPADYAELVIVGTRNGVSSDGTRLLRSSTVTGWNKAASSDLNYSYGRNLSASDINGGGRFSHSGQGHGSRTYMCGSSSTGRGLVVMFNRRKDKSKGSTDAIDSLRNEIKAAFNGAFPGLPCR